VNELPPPGIYGDPRVDTDPQPSFGLPDPIRGPHPEAAPPHEILKAAIMQMLANR
jgi:hypothetical protein